MKWILLIGDEKLNLDLIKKVEHFGSISITDVSDNRLVVDYGSEQIFYDYVEDLINEYEEEEILYIPFSNSKFIMMVYTSDELMKKVLIQDNYLKEIYVDNDNGLIVPIEEFIKQL